MIPMELLEAVKWFGDAAKTIAAKGVHKDY